MRSCFGGRLPFYFDEDFFFVVFIGHGNLYCTKKLFFACYFAAS
jgi:hypothetical protein